MTALVVASVWLLTTVLAGDVNYRDVVVNRKSDYMSRYFRRLYRRQRHCEEPGLAERVRMADVILTGTIRALEADLQRPGSEIARVEVKRIFKNHDQVRVLCCSGHTIINQSINQQLVYMHGSSKAGLKHTHD